MTLGERDPEAKVADLRSNALVLAIPSLLLLVVAAALGFVLFRLPEEWQRWTAIGVAAFVILVGFVLPLAAWLARRYTVTTRRTIIRDGLVWRSRRTSTTFAWRISRRERRTSPSRMIVRRVVTV